MMCNTLVLYTQYYISYDVYSNTLVLYTQYHMMCVNSIVIH